MLCHRSPQPFAAAIIAVCSVGAVTVIGCGWLGCRTYHFFFPEYPG